MAGRNASSALLPLVLLWLAAHAVLLALLLGLKFVALKTVAIMLLLLGAGAAFLFRKVRPGPRKLTHSPVV
ncbi:MAG TPA: hypothetical protein VK515_03465 [Rhizomicrobium sp.]|nr:hypothetical protein [Rhizomicrobium sp.]